MKDGAPQLHERFQNNILGRTNYEVGNFEEAIKEPGLVRIEVGMIPCRAALPH
jgi:xanthine dehydrogenase molybdenum-binding subunit